MDGIWGSIGLLLPCLLGICGKKERRVQAWKGEGGGGGGGGKILTRRFGRCSLSTLPIAGRACFHYVGVEERTWRSTYFFLRRVHAFVHNYILGLAHCDP